MKIYHFLRMPKLEDKDDFSKMKEGDCFLYGWKMKTQTETKKVDHEVSFYRVLKVKGKNVEYIVEFDILEEDQKEEIQCQNKQ